ncbi:MAG: formylglycine-generating enzyme family protein [Deltaproteobacteria bacterium]|nr:formylglycine-generating enzyme family protein [Deltaproteobacteria bacterium]
MLGLPSLALAKPTPSLPVLKVPGTDAIDLVLVRAGQFQMGSPATERKREGNETQHRVTITRDFYLGKTEVTQAQYEAVMGYNPTATEHRYFEAANVGSHKPVVGVTFEDAEAFCAKLSEQTGRKVRLPTEAEWELACKGGGQAAGPGPFSPGVTEENLSAYAWFAKTARLSEEVGLKKPTNLGLLDLHGNVWEWTSDWFAPYESGDAVDPQGPATSTKVRVFRGGCSFNPLHLQRCSFRHAVSPEYKDAAIGFRILVEAPHHPASRRKAPPR